MYGLTFLVVRDKSLGNGLSDGVDLSYVTSSVHSHSDVYAGETLL